MALLSSVSMFGRTAPAGSFAAAVSLTLLSGCSGAPKFEPDAPAPGLTLGTTGTSEGPLTAEVAFARDPLIARYDRFVGGSSRPSRKAGEIQIFGDAEQWMVERYVLPTDDRADRRLERRILLGEGADGSILLRESVGGKESLTTVFDPPVRLAAPVMQAGDVIESTFTPRIRDASGDRNEAGEGTARITYAGRQLVETPMGSFEADLLMTEFVFDFGVVRIDRKARQWYATVRPGRTAIVAEDIVERRTVFGFTSTDRVRLAITSLVR